MLQLRPGPSPIQLLTRVPIDGGRRFVWCAWKRMTIWPGSHVRLMWLIVTIPTGEGGVRRWRKRWRRRWRNSGIVIATTRRRRKRECFRLRQCWRWIATTVIFIGIFDDGDKVIPCGRYICPFHVFTPVLERLIGPILLRKKSGDLGSRTPETKKKKRANL